MKKVLVTQRLDQNHSYYEIRQGLDIKLTEYIYACGFMPIIVPFIKDVAEFIKQTKPAGLILSGGNDLTQINPINNLSIIRDNLELQTIQICDDLQIPILGICRGMQLILSVFDQKFKPLKDHVATRHSIKLKNNSLLSHYLSGQYVVNSYHNYGLLNCTNKCIEILGRCEHDNSIESIKHKTKNIYGIMWHPEREKKFDENMLHLFKKVFD